MKQLTPAEEEAYVRSRWERVSPPHSNCMGKGCAHVGSYEERIITAVADTCDETGHVLWMKTKHREAEIADVEK